MIIRIVGFLGALIGFSFICAAFEQLYVNVLLPNTAYNIGAKVGGIIGLLLGFFLLFYGLKWLIEGYGEKQKELLEQEDFEKLKGLKGWLIIVGIGLILGLLRKIIVACIDLPPIFSSGVLEALTTTGSKVYNPALAYYVTAELIINACLLLANVILIYLFFTKKRIFPKFYIIVAITTLVLVLADALFFKFIIPSEIIFDKETLKELFRAFATCVIWVPYMLKSKRVKATFV